MAKRRSYQLKVSDRMPDGPRVRCEFTGAEILGPLAGKPPLTQALADHQRISGIRSSVPLCLREKGIRRGGALNARLRRDGNLEVRR
jgi:hypothetical protein